MVHLSSSFKCTSSAFCLCALMFLRKENWPVRKENEVALQRAAELRMVRWMCGVKLQDRVSSKELRGRLRLDDIISVLYSKTGCDGIGMCCEKKRTTG